MEHYYLLFALIFLFVFSGAMYIWLYMKRCLLSQKLQNLKDMEREYQSEKAKIIEKELEIIHKPFEQITDCDRQELDRLLTSREKLLDDFIKEQNKELERCW